MIQLGQHTSSFEQTVDRWVVDAMRSHPHSFRSLVHALPGVFPVQVRSSLTRLASDEAVPIKAALRVLDDAARPTRKVSFRTEGGLPVPHPLDFDWRFTQTATQMLSRISQSLGEHIACIGTPSVFACLNERMSKSDAYFFDRNEASIDYFRSLGISQVGRLDCFRDDAPQVNFDAVVMDPPWYEKHYQAFMWMASQVVRLDGVVVLALPPLGTRPSVDLERSRVVDWGQRLGLELVQLTENCLPYETPHFEINALRKSGIRCNLGAWRRGTLAIFRMHSPRRVSRPVNARNDDWDEVALLGTRFRFRRKREFGLVAPSLERIVNGDVLKSVSRTDPIRRAVDIWTSGNRVFRCTAPTQLYEQFSRFTSSVSKPSVDLSNVKLPRKPSAVRQLLKIAIIEKRERSVDCFSQSMVP